MKKKDNKITYLLLIFFTGLIIFGLIKIFIWNKDNNENKKIKDDINDYIKVKDDDYDIDFKKLKQINPDVVAWIIVPNTNISYPVVKTTNNVYYTDHNFRKQKNKAGWVFMNYLNKFDGKDKNISIFAHNRLDGSMFGTLKKTLNKSWQEKNKDITIKLITEDEEIDYQVFSTYKIEVEDYYIKSNFNTTKEYQIFLDRIKTRSNYNYNIDLNTNDSVLTLSTCDINNDYRTVLHAKKVS